MPKRHNLHMTKRRAAQLARYASEPPCYVYQRTRLRGSADGTEDGRVVRVKPRNSPLPGFRFKP